MKLLVVDDSRLARRQAIKVFKAVLEEKNPELKIVEAGNGEEAIQQYKNEKPDLVSMDLTMPVMDGFDAIKNIVDFDNNAKIIAVSADIQKASLSKVIENGASYFIQKPIDAQKLETALKSL